MPRRCSMNWADDQLYHAIVAARGLGTDSFPASMREQLCDSDGTASVQSRLNWGAVYYRHHRRPSVFAQARGSVITLIATKLGRSRMTVGTLLVLALALAWDVQRAWCATPADVPLVELARSKFANLT